MFADVLASHSHLVGMLAISTIVKKYINWETVTTYFKIIIFLHTKELVTQTDIGFDKKADSLFTIIFRIWPSIISLWFIDVLLWDSGK